MRKYIRSIDVCLLMIVAFAGFLNSYGIWHKGYANPYYTSAVVSMLENFRNFFFVAFDPSGFISIDKPPVAFWLQTLSAALFGLKGWSIILPQVLTGTASVWLIYKLVYPSFGKGAARFSAFVLACTPIFTAVNRTNNVDSILIFTLLLAVWMLFKFSDPPSTESPGIQKIGWAVGAFALIGIGFNIKMLQAYMVLPAFYLFFVLADRSGWKKKLGIAVVLTAVIIAVSFSWPLTVDTVSADARPYVGGSTSNSVLDMAFGYNGVSRLTGVSGEESRFARLFTTGEEGILRLFNSHLSTQISWLLPLALWSSITLLPGRKRLPEETGKRGLSRQQQEAWFWLAWLIPAMGFFSVAGFFHTYYLAMLAPPIAALTGAGWARMTEERNGSVRWKKWLLPAGLAVSVLFEMTVLFSQEDLAPIWLWSVGGAGLIMTLLLCLPLKKRWIQAGAMLGFVVLAAAPGYWAATPALYGGMDILPEAGPQLAGIGQGEGWANQLKDNVDEKFLDYVKSHNTGETYLFGITDSSLIAAPYIIQTGEPVMALGGFSGSDPVLTQEQLEELIKERKIKYFLVGSGGSRGGNEPLIEWIKGVGREIPAEEWQSAGSGLGGSLYEVDEVAENGQ